MAVIQKTLIIKWHPKTKEYYESKGYIFTKFYDEFEIKIEDIYPKSGKNIMCECDYCGKHFLKRSNRVYFTIHRKLYSEKKIACSDCMYKKVSDVNMERYGVKSPLQRPIIKEKMILTNIQKYGVKNVSQSKQIRDKIKENNLRKYGFEHPMKNDKVKQNLVNSMIKKYNVENIGQYEPLKEKRISKMMKTMYQNNDAPCSKQQQYICDLLNGELNYPVSRNWLDIAFPNEMIYVEYDGSGHNLNVKIGNMSQEEFNYHELKRRKYLKKLGWKLIRIKSKKDLLPKPDDLLILIDECKNKIKNNSWVILDIDEKIIYNKNEKIDLNLNFYPLYKIKKED